MIAARAATRVAAAALAMLLTAAIPARAAEDAGTTSSLSQGSGTRALALGGAYAAIADDAGGWMWNPAGLGLVQRSQFQFANTRLDALDLTEQYVGYVVPSWRWGALGLTYRQVGVTGIDGRDDRNAPLGGELSAKESEIALAYGIRLNDAWGLGLAAKTRRQDVAGRTGNAVGADLGAQLTPARLMGNADAGAWEGLRVGFAVRNFLRPSIQLDLDEVADPTAMRLGLAYERPIGGLQTVLAAFDVERVEGVSPRVHAGLEWHPHPSADARAGFDGDGLTAGMALRMRGLALDYAFADRAIEPEHRLGLTFAFGATVEESRVAAVRARDAELEQAVTGALDARAEEQARGLRARFESAMRAGDPVRAREALDMLRVLRPDDVSLRVEEAKLLGLEAARAEAGSDLLGAVSLYRQAANLAPEDRDLAGKLQMAEQQMLRNAAEVDSFANALRGAMDRAASGSLAEARRSLQALARARPGDSVVTGLLDRVDRGIQARAAALAAQASRAIEAENIAEADRAIAELRVLAPAHPGLPRLGASLESARAAARVAKGSPDVPGTPGRRADAERHFKQALTLLSGGRRAEALRWLEIVLTEDPSHRMAAQLLVREYQVQGLEAFSAGRLQAAVEIWQRALDADPSNARTLAYLSRAREQMARISEAGVR